MYNCKARDIFCKLNWQVFFKRSVTSPGNGHLPPSVSTIILYLVTETRYYMCIKLNIYNHYFCFPTQLNLNKLERENSLLFERHLQWFLLVSVTIKRIDSISSLVVIWHCNKTKSLTLIVFVSISDHINFGDGAKR